MGDHDFFSSVAQRRTLLAAGTNDSAIRRATVDGEFSRVRRGAYLLPGQEVPAWNRHALVVAATVPKLAGGAVVSHASAAALHGLAVWPPPSDRVHVTRHGASGGGRRTRTLHLHIGSLSARDVITVGGMAATSLARTVVDLARTESFESGVVTADHALHGGLVDREGLAAVLSEQETLNGFQRAGTVLSFADGRSESVGESRSRVAMLLAGLPSPTLQRSIYTRDGDFIGRADFAYPEQRIVGEFDGRQKYHLGFTVGVQPVDVVVAERRRGDAMERAGWIVVRWMWEDLAVPSIIGRKLNAAFDRRGPSR